MRVPGDWRLQVERYCLIGVTCARCGARTFPARRICPNCDVRPQVPSLFSGHSELFNQDVSRLLENDTQDGATHATARAVVLASLVADQ